MKLQTSKKAIKNGFKTVLSVGYCSAQNLLYFKSPFAYSCGIYGWSCDYYQINNVCISTGYSPIGTNVDYSLLRDLELKAEKIVHDHTIKYEDQKFQIDLLLNELINSVKK